MDFNEDDSPNLEINLKKSCSNESKKLRKILKLGLYSNYTTSRNKAYSFFFFFVEKERKNKMDNENNLKKLPLMSIENYKNKKNSLNESKQINRKYISNKVKIILDKIKRKTPKNLNFYNSSLNDSNFKEKKNSKNKSGNLYKEDFLSPNLCLIAKKEKDTILHKNFVDGNFNINNQIIKPYMNKKVFPNENIENNKIFTNNNIINKSFLSKGAFSFDKLKSIQKLINKNNKLLTIERNVFNTISNIKKVHLTSIYNLHKPKHKNTIFIP